MRIENGRIRGFDGLRAVAFLMVFVSHKIHFAHAGSFGDAGVWLFFVLSGFLITRILANFRSDIESRRATITSSLGRFYLRRTARIFPPYYLILAFFLVLSNFVVIDYFGRSEKFAYLFFLTNILVAVRNHWIGNFGHLWTLAVEEQFYLMFAPIVLLTPRKHTITICFAIIAVGLTTKILLEMANAPRDSIDVNSLVNFALLGFGGVIGLTVNRASTSWFSGGNVQAAVLCLYLALPAAFGTWPLLWPLLGKLSALVVGILLFLIFHNQKSWLVNILESGPLRNIGRVSYGAYLIHEFIHVSRFADFFQPFGVDIVVPRLLQVPTEFAITLIFAAASWRFLEKPIIEYAHRSGGHKPNAIALDSRHPQRP